MENRIHVFNAKVQLAEKHLVISGGYARKSHTTAFKPFDQLTVRFDFIGMVSLLTDTLELHLPTGIVSLGFSTLYVWNATLRRLECTSHATAWEAVKAAEEKSRQEVARLYALIDMKVRHG